MSSIEKGLVHVYTGDGKGKTTAALGLALRACGRGLKAYMVQFMKGWVYYGELDGAGHVPGFTIRQFGRPDFVDKEDPAQVDIDKAAEGLAHAREVVLAGEHDIVILDEVNVAIEFNLIGVGEVQDVIRAKPGHVELVLTGRWAPPEILEMADYVTEMREIKHPFRKGVPARPGIEH